MGVRPTDFSFFQGNDFNLQITITENGSTLDITGATVAFRARRDGTSSMQVDEDSATGNVTLTTPASGIADLDLTDVQTDALTPGFYYYEWKVTKADTTEYTAKAGWFEVKESLFV